MTVSTVLVIVIQLIQMKIRREKMEEEFVERKRDGNDLLLQSIRR